MELCKYFFGLDHISLQQESTNQMPFNFQSIVEFIDNICSKCRNLEAFEYQGLDFYPDRKSNFGTSDLKMPSKDEDKFPNLTYIKLEFSTHPSVSKSKSDIALEKFKKYLTAKCPNLKKSIQRNKGEYHYQVLFESNGLKDFESLGLEDSCEEY